MRRHAGLLGLLVILLVALPTGVVWAHPEIITTEPSANAQLSTSPAQVRVVFNEPIETAFAELQVFSAQGQAVDSGDGGRSPNEPTVLIVSVPSLEPGLYTVVWQVLGSDGHVVKGNFVFTLLQLATTPAPGGATDTPVPLATVTPLPIPSLSNPSNEARSPAPTNLIALLRTLMLIGAIGNVGGWVFVVSILYPVLPSGAQAIRHAALRRWRLVVGVSLAILLLATLAFMTAHTLNVAGRIDGESLNTVLRETRLGQAAQIRLLLVIPLAVLTVFAPTGFRRWIGLGLAGLILLTFSEAGHAAARLNNTLPIILDWFHLAATSAWIGGLMFLLLTLPAIGVGLSIPKQAEVLARLVTRFSTLALVCIIVLVVTGTYAALLHLTVLSDVWVSEYGRILLIKLFLFGGLLLFGAYHLLIMRAQFVGWTTRTAEAGLMSRWRQRFQGSLAGEIGVAFLLLSTVGFLTNTAPPASQALSAIPMTATTVPSESIVGAETPALAPTLPPTRTPAPIVPFAQTQQAGDLQVGLEVQPGAIGKNDIVVRVQDNLGSPLDVQRVQFTLDMPTMDMGETQIIAEPQGSGRYVATDTWLSMVGEWRVRVIVRRIDANDVEVEFMVPVGG